MDRLGLAHYKCECQCHIVYITKYEIIPIVRRVHLFPYSQRHFAGTMNVEMDKIVPILVLSDYPRSNVFVATG